jgi:hypothetical protein
VPCGHWEGKSLCLVDTQRCGPSALGSYLRGLMALEADTLGSGTRVCTDVSWAWPQCS